MVTSSHPFSAVMTEAVRQLSGCSNAISPK
jgi:hypothetical protein